MEEVRALEDVTCVAREERSLRGLARCALLFAIGFALVAFVQRRLFPDELRMDTLSLAQEEAWRAQSSDFDLAFFGSSHIQMGLIPEVVDARLAERGLPLRSFNFGVPGGFSFETDWLLRRVLAMRGPRLRYVVVELPDWTVDTSNLESQRMVAWHDSRLSRDVLEALRGNVPSAEAWSLGLTHTRLFAMRALSLGIGPQIFGARGEVFEATLARVSAGAGYDLSPKVAQADRRRTKRVAAMAQRTDEEQTDPLFRWQKGFEQRVDDLRAGRGQELGMDRYPLELLRAQRDFIRGLGLEVVYVVTPVPRLTSWVDELQRAGELPALIRFNDVARYPELLSVETHRDDQHLNYAGMQLFSRCLADGLVDLLASGALAPR